LEINTSNKKNEELEIIFLSKIFFLWGYLDKKDLLENISEKSKDEIHNSDIVLHSHKIQSFSVSQIKNLREKINENISKIAF
jgi:predicted MPP superfamily phosphohydrolase